jgi:hypothetical protein
MLFCVKGSQAQISHFVYFWFTLLEQHPPSIATPPHFGKAPYNSPFATSHEYSSRKISTSLNTPTSGLVSQVQKGGDIEAKCNLLYIWEVVSYFVGRWKKESSSFGKWMLL